MSYLIGRVNLGWHVDLFNNIIKWSTIANTAKLFKCKATGWQSKLGEKLSTIILLDIGWLSKMFDIHSKTTEKCDWCLEAYLMNSFFLKYEQTLTPCCVPGTMFVFIPVRQRARLDWKCDSCLKGDNDLIRRWPNLLWPRTKCNKRFFSKPTWVGDYRRIWWQESDVWPINVILALLQRYHYKLDF